MFDWFLNTSLNLAFLIPTPGDPWQIIISLHWVKFWNCTGATDGIILFSLLNFLKADLSQLHLIVILFSAFWKSCFNTSFSLFNFHFKRSMKSPLIFLSFLYFYEKEHQIKIIYHFYLSRSSKLSFLSFEYLILLPFIFILTLSFIFT